jgi:peptidoglycan/xylan/chitin deacetylase (PgdA/CDA1 family)
MLPRNRNASAQAVPVFMYHHVSPGMGALNVSPANFARQMAYLAQAGYTTLSADAFLQFIEGRASAPPKSVLITFDDGYLDNYVYAYPILQRLGLRAVIFAVTSWVGEGPARAHADAGMPSLPACPDHGACKASLAASRQDEVIVRWSEIETMEASGTIEIHSHTHRHLRWEQQFPHEAARLEAVAADLSQSRQTLLQRLGRADPQLCWPWGYFEPGYQTLATQLGFRAQYTTEPGLTTPHSPADRIARIAAKNKTGAWLGSRAWLYRHPALGALYLKLSGKSIAAGG